MQGYGELHLRLTSYWNYQTFLLAHQHSQINDYSVTAGQGRGLITSRTSRVTALRRGYGYLIRISWNPSLRASWVTTSHREVDLSTIFLGRQKTSLAGFVTAVSLSCSQPPLSVTHVSTAEWHICAATLAPHLIDTLSDRLFYLYRAFQHCCLWTELFRFLKPCLVYLTLRIAWELPGPVYCKLRIKTLFVLLLYCF